MEQLKRKYQSMSVEARAALWFALCNFLNKEVAMIVVPLYTRLLTTEEYGTYTVFQSWLNLFVILATLEISRGHYKVGITKYEEDADRYTTSVLGLSNAVTIGFAAVYACAMPFFNRMLGMPTDLVISMLLYLLVYPAWEFWAIRQRFAYRYKTMVAATLAVAVLSPVMGVAYWLHLQSGAAIFSKLAVQGAFALGICLLFWRKSQVWFHRIYWKEAFVFNLTLVPYLLSTSILNQADRIMIDSMVGAAEAAVYSVAYSAAMLMQLLDNAVSDAFIPWMYRRLKAGEYRSIEPVTNKLLILAAGANLLLILFAPEVIAVFAPGRYRDAIWVIPPVAASVFFHVSLPAVHQCGSILWRHGQRQQHLDPCGRAEHPVELLLHPKVGLSGRRLYHLGELSGFLRRPLFQSQKSMPQPLPGASDLHSRLHPRDQRRVSGAGVRDDGPLRPQDAAVWAGCRFVRIGLV